MGTCGGCHACTCVSPAPAESAILGVGEGGPTLFPGLCTRNGAFWDSRVSSGLTPKWLEILGRDPSRVSMVVWGEARSRAGAHRL